MYLETTKARNALQGYAKSESGTLHENEDFCKGMMLYCVLSYDFCLLYLLCNDEAGRLLTRSDLTSPSGSFDRHEKRD